MALDAVSKEERERLRLAFFDAYKDRDGFSACSVRSIPGEGPYVHCEVRDLYLNWPEEFEGYPVWVEEVYPTLQQDPLA